MVSVSGTNIEEIIQFQHDSLRGYYIPRLNAAMPSSAGPYVPLTEVEVELIREINSAHLDLELAEKPLDIINTIVRENFDIRVNGYIFGMPEELVNEKSRGIYFPEAKINGGVWPVNSGKIRLVRYELKEQAL